MRLFPICSYLGVSILLCCNRVHQGSPLLAEGVADLFSLISTSNHRKTWDDGKRPRAIHRWPLEVFEVSLRTWEGGLEGGGEVGKIPRPRRMTVGAVLTHFLAGSLFFKSPNL